MRFIHLAVPTLFIFLLFSCNNVGNSQENKTTDSSESHSTANIDTLAGHAYNNEHSSCYSRLTELIRSSNFPFGNIPKEKVNILIDEDNDSVVRMKLFFNTDGSGTIGWAEYRVQKQTLLNTSADLEAPQTLVFDKKWAREYQQCLGSSRDTVTCTDFQVEMGKGTRCFYPGRTQQDAYRIVLKEHRDESKHLMPVIPATDTTYESNRDDEQVDVAYTIGKNNTHITLNYPGGVTEIEMTEANSSTTLCVIYNAD